MLQVSLIGDFINRLGGVQPRVVLPVEIQHLSAHRWLLVELKSPSGISSLLSDNCRALKIKLLQFQKFKTFVRELYELHVACGSAPTENIALGESSMTWSNPIECTGPSYLYKVTYVLIF